MAIETIGEIGTQLNLRIRQGTDWAAEFTATNPDGSPVDLTGVVISARMSKTPSKGPSVDFTITILDAAGASTSSL